MCDCPTCQRSRRIENIGLGDDIKKMKKLIEELHGLVLNLEMDNDHYAAILNGGWPNSEAILNASLKKIKG